MSQHKQDEVKNSDNKTLDEYVKLARQERDYDSLLFDGQTVGFNTYRYFELALKEQKDSAEYRDLVNISSLVAGTMLYEHQTLQTQCHSDMKFYKEVLKGSAESKELKEYIVNKSATRFTVTDRNDLNQYIRSCVSRFVARKYSKIPRDPEAERRGRILWERFLDPPEPSTSQVSSGRYSSPETSTGKTINPAQYVYVQTSDGSSFMKVRSSQYHQDTSYS